MKVTILNVLLAIFASTSARTIERVIDLPVDHFNHFDTRTFNVHYLVNNEFFVAGGPIFIYGSGRANYGQFLERGVIFEIAEETNGSLFSLEHRYYGDSRPTADLSAENLQWLTYHQALADIAQFISFIKANYVGTSDSKVILWGRGWGAAMSVWARQKYPNLIDGAWASSAHLNIVLSHPELLSNSFNTLIEIGGPECGDVLTGAFRTMEDAVRFRNTTYVEERLNLCAPIDLDIQESVTRLFYGIGSDIGYDFMTLATYSEVEEKCFIMLGLDNPENPPENDLDAFARWYVDDYKRDLSCLDFSNYQNEQIGWEKSTGGRQNAWFQCTQAGQFPIANEGENHPFGWRFDLAWYKFYCGQLFGVELFTDEFIADSISKTNEFFGGSKPNVEQVFFTHGEMDPRRDLGVREEFSPNSPVALIPNHSYGRDFDSPSETDDEILLQTMARGRELVLQWIGHTTN